MNIYEQHVKEKPFTVTTIAVKEYDGTKLEAKVRELWGARVEKNHQVGTKLTTSGGRLLREVAKKGGVIFFLNHESLTPEEVKELLEQGEFPVTIAGNAKYTGAMEGIRNQERVAFIVKCGKTVPTVLSFQKF